MRLESLLNSMFFITAICSVSLFLNQIKPTSAQTFELEYYYRDSNNDGDLDQSYDPLYDEPDFPHSSLDRIVTQDGHIIERTGEWEGIPGVENSYDEIEDGGDIFYMPEGEIYEHVGNMDW
jgi:hypothetical protein